MGTNYFWHEKLACAACGHAPKPRHIGKSSGGWCFSLHVYPDEGISTLEDWKQRFNQAGTKILNEYDEEITPAWIIGNITQRSSARRDPFEPDFLAKNDAEPGPRGLLRHQIGPFCIGHGEGTYDYIVGSFS